VRVHRLTANFATEMMPHRHNGVANEHTMDTTLPIPPRLMLGIESSCDDTSIAVIRGNVFLAQFTAAQHIHAKYGGVVPEFASRAHQRHILPVLEGALEQAGCTLDDIEGVAYTRGPGLHGSLLVGSAFARSLAWARNLPMWPVHHMRAHVLAHWLEDAQPPSGPMMALTVSGGHTQLVDVRSPWELEVVGATLDDAAGEAFDKVAKMIGLPYPGGPHVDRLAQEGDPDAFGFAAPRMDGLDFSFSGLKTSVLRTLEKGGGESMEREGWRADVCASLQRTIVTMLVSRLEEATDLHGRNAIAIQGGVSANSGLRKAVQALGERRGWSVHVPPFKYCTDNGAMIAMAGQFAAMKGEEGDLSDGPLPRWPMFSSQT
jgi:N6-L-threonylcarbamoyladenine synthase